MRLIPLIAMVLLAASTGCSAAPPKRFDGGPWQHGDPSLPQPGADDHARCRALGGDIGPITRLWSHCIYPALDAGAACTDPSECEGTCLADEAIPPGTAATGHCSARVNEIGCINLLVKGEALGFRCVD